MQTYRLTTSSWKMNMARRVGALGIDVAVALFIAITGFFAVQATGLASVTGRTIMPLAFGIFALFRIVGSSFGNLTVGIRVDGSSFARNVLRLLALIAPAYNLFDWVYAIWNPAHQTFTDAKLGVRVVDDMLRCLRLGY